MEAEFRACGLGSLAILEDHLLNVVLLQLSLPDLARASVCSKALRTFALEEPLWQHQALTLCSDEALEYKANWRQTALQIYAKQRVALASAACSRDAAGAAAPIEASTSLAGLEKADTTLPLGCPTRHSMEAAARPPAPVPLQSQFLYKRWLRCHMDLRGFLPHAQTVPRADASALDAARFLHSYDAACAPVVLQHAMADWPQAHDWSLEGLVAAYGSCVFIVTKPGAATGHARMQLSHYCHYMARQSDEEPLYVFDANFGTAAPALLDAYKVPAVFAQDLFAVLGGAERPPWRWLVLGPARSGAPWHVDPKGTSAWNALCSGRKRWALYPPTVVPPGVGLLQTGPDSMEPSDAFTSLQWYLEVYPALAPHQRPLEFVQEPGEVVFVPGGWWHMVLNLEASVAVTQNFVSSGNLDRVVQYMAHGSLHYHTHTRVYYPPRMVSMWQAAHSPTGQEEPTSEGMEEDNDSDSESGSGSMGGSEDADDMDAAAVDQEDVQIAKDTSSKAFADPAADGSEHHNLSGTGLCVAGSKHLPLLQVRVALDTGDDAVDRGHTGATMKDCLNGIGHISPPNNACLAAASAHCWRAAWGLPTFPMQRDRLLGRWLRLLLTEQPQLEPAIAASARTHLGAGHWAHVLHALSTALCAHPHVSSASPTSHGQSSSTNGSKGAPLSDLLPLCGVDSLVFLSSTIAVKVVGRPGGRLVAGLMCALEASVPRMLGLADMGSAAASSSDVMAAIGSSPAIVPAPLAWGRLHVSFPADTQRCKRTLPGTDALSSADGDTGATRTAACGSPAPGVRTQRRQQLPFVITQIADALTPPGCTLVPLKEVWAGLDTTGRAGVCQQLGCMLAGLHVRGHLAARQLQQLQQQQQYGMSSTGCTLGRRRWGLPAWQQLVQRSSNWHDRDGNLWVSGLGQVLQEGQPVNASNATSIAGTPGALQHSCTQLWQPYLSFLAHRRLAIIPHLRDGGELPAWMVDQVDAFLPGPEAVAELVCVGPGTSCLPNPPILLHGDLTINNILLPQPAAGQPASADLCHLPPAPEAGSAPAGGHHSPVLVDFSDAGWGDALYDVVTLYGSVLRWDGKMFAAFWSAYTAALPAALALHSAGTPAQGGATVGVSAAEALGLVWPARRVRLSHAAMAVALLHEEMDMVRGLATRTSYLLSAASRARSARAGNDGGGRMEAGSTAWVIGNDAAVLAQAAAEMFGCLDT